MVDVNIKPFEIEVRTRHGDMVRADVYLPRDTKGRVPVLLGASPYQKVRIPIYSGRVFRREAPVPI